MKPGMQENSRWHAKCLVICEVKRKISGMPRLEKLLAALLGIGIIAAAAWPVTRFKDMPFHSGAGFTITEMDCTSPLLFSPRDIAALNACISRTAEFAGYDEFYSRVTVNSRIEVARVTRFAGPLIRLQKLKILAGTAQTLKEGDILISEGYWDEKFARDSAVLGKSIIMNQQPVRIAGVVRTSPLFNETQVWLPASLRGICGNMPCLRITGLLKGTTGTRSAEADLREVLSLRVNGADVAFGDGLRIVPLERVLPIMATTLLTASRAGISEGTPPQT